MNKPITMPIGVKVLNICTKNRVVSSQLARATLAVSSLIEKRDNLSPSTKDTNSPPAPVINDADIGSLGINWNGPINPVAIPPFPTI